MRVKRAVRCCRQCGVAGGEPVPLAPLGWYFVINSIKGRVHKEFSMKGGGAKHNSSWLYFCHSFNKNGIAMNRKDRRSCNAAPPAKSKMANRGPQNDQRDPERGLPLGTTELEL